MAPINSRQLVGLLGADSVLPADRLDEYCIDGLVPQAVVRPDSRQGIAETMRWASREGATVFPRGGGTQLALGNVPQRVDLVLDLRRCGRILDFQPSDLTVTVEAGITLDSLQRELAQGGKFLAVEAPLSASATIGGILATQAGGPLRSGYGLPRDWLIGIRVVSPEGVETKAGGKVVKNVTGYDLDKLYTGSLGTLGVIVEATFKLSPLPGDSGALIAVFPTLQRAIGSGERLQRQVYAPQGLQVIDRQVAGRLGIIQGGQDAGGVFGGESSGLEGEEALAAAFFSGRTGGVQRKLREAGQLLRDEGASRVEAISNPEAAALLRRLTDLGWTKGLTPYLGLKVSVAPSAAGRVVEWLRSDSTTGRHGLLALAPSEMPPGIAADPGFGLVWVMWWVGDGEEGPIDESRMVGDIGRIREFVRGLGGSAVVENAPPALKQRTGVWGDPPDGIEIMRRIKEKFDPRRILNPGRFVGGI